MLLSCPNIFNVQQIMHSATVCHFNSYKPQLVLLMHLGVDEQLHSTSLNFAECHASSK
jgi:hypothetical protein